MNKPPLIDLGIAKGIIMILVGAIFLNNMSYGALLGNQDTGDGGMLASGVVWAWIIFGLFLWRGIVAIRKRKVREVTRLNLGVWIGVLTITLVWTIWLVALGAWLAPG